MKKTFHIIAVFAIICGMLTSCNDEWKDELYEQLVSFKAPVGSNGVHDIYIRYNADGTGQFKLPVIVSGSRNNGKDINIKISVDNDTLDILNSERFASGRQDLWFRQLPEQFYTLSSPTCLIKAGENTSIYTVDFNLTGLNTQENWVLPLTIDRDPSYKLNIRDGWYKALLNVKLFNDFSGTYASSNMYVYIDGQNSDGAVEDYRECRVVDDRTVFFLAGTTWSEDINRALYKINARFEEGTTDEKGVITGNITLSPGNPSNAIDLETSGSCTYRYEVIKHATKPDIERRITTMYLDYKYTDITSDSEKPIRFHVRGNMTMERQYNTRIPDEDQAVLW